MISAQAKSVEPSVFETVVKVRAPSINALYLVVFRRKPGSQEARRRADTWGRSQPAALLLRITTNLLFCKLHQFEPRFRRVSGAKTQYLVSLAKTSIKN